MQGLSSLDPRAMRGWFLRVLNSQGQWKREWYCTRCGQGVKCKVTSNMNRQGLADVTCEKAQWGACKVRRLKWSDRQRQADLEAPTALQTDGREQAPPPGKHIPQKVLGKRVGRGQTLHQTSHTETSVVGPYDQVEIEHPPWAEMESNLRSTGHEDCRANEGGGRASARPVMSRTRRWKKLPPPIGRDHRE